MRLSKELILIVLVLAVLIAVNVLRKRSTQASSTEGAGVEYTSFSTESQGTKAIYLLLEKLGYKPKRLRMPHFTELRAAGLAIILAPDRHPIDNTDAKRVLEWLRQGNKLLFVPVKRSEQLAKSLEVELHQKQSLEASITPLALTNLTVGINRLVVRSGNRILTKRTDAVHHFGDKEGGVAISLREGAGTAIILSDPYLMTNAGLPKGDNLALLVNILLSYAADTKTVYFDEYHHGFERRPTLLYLLRASTLGWALLQVSAAVALLMYSRGRRFSRPKPPRTRGETHRSSVEYVASLAGIYQTVQASNMALSNIYESLLHSMGSSPPSESIRELMDRCKRKMEGGKISDKDLVDLSKRIELARHPREE